MTYSAEEIFAMVEHDRSTNHIMAAHRDAAEKLATSIEERTAGLQNPQFDVETMLAQGQFGTALGREIQTLLEIAYANAAQITALHAGIDKITNRVNESYDDIAMRKTMHDAAVADPAAQEAIALDMLRIYGTTYQQHVADANAIPEIPAYSGPREPVEIDWPSRRPRPEYGPNAPTTPGVTDRHVPVPSVPPPPPESGAPILQSAPPPAAPPIDVGPRPLPPVAPAPAPPPVVGVPPVGTVPPVIGSRPTPTPYGTTKPAIRPGTSGTVRPVIGSRPGPSGTPRLPTGGGTPGRPGGTPTPRAPGSPGANRGQLPGANRSLPPGANRVQPTGANRPQPGANRSGALITSRPSGGTPKSPGVRIARQATPGGPPQARGTGLGQGRAMPRGPRSVTPSVIGRSVKSGVAPGQGAPGVRAPGQKSVTTGPVIGRPPVKTVSKKIEDKEPPKGSDLLEEWVDLPPTSPGVIRSSGPSTLTTDSGPVLFGRRRKSAEADDPENW